MQFITSLFGGSGNTALTAILALGVVLVLIIIALWLLKLVSKASGNAVRGRNRRLAVIDTLNIDQKRQLLIIRRDNVEHLVLIGGLQDLVVETGIEVVEQPTTQPTRRPLPMIAKRDVKKPEAAAPVPTPATPPTPAAAPVVTAAPGTVLEQLQRAGHPADKKGHVSLRHTGLLRPVNSDGDQQAGQKDDISTGTRLDSDKQSAETDLREIKPLETDTSPEANRG